MSPYHQRPSEGKSKTAAAIAILSAFFALGTAAAQGETGAQGGNSGDSVSLKDLEQKVLILERKLEVKDEEAAAKAVDAPKFTSGPDGFVFKSADEAFQLKWRALLQVDYRAFVDGQDTGSQRTYLNRYPNNFPSTFLLRKVRPYFDVVLWKFAQFRIMPDFGGGSTTLLDAYGDLAFSPALKLRAGKFTAPLGLERYQAAADNFFVEYGLPSNLSRNRDLGAQIFGDLRNDSYSYSLGVFNGAVEGANKDNDSTTHKDIVGRLFVQPFKTGNVGPLQGLGLGIAGAWGKHYGDSVNTSLPVYRTPGQNTFFSYRTSTTSRDTATAQAKGTFYSLIPQGYWFLGSFGLLGEYAFTSQEAWIPKNPKASKTPLEASSWQAIAVYVVTGEQPSYKGLKPRHPLNAGGFGAVELVARVGQLNADLNHTFPAYADSTRSAREATAIGGGVNWYLNRAVKWVFDYEQTAFKGGNRVTVNDRDDEKVFTTRLQFNY